MAKSRMGRVISQEWRDKLSAAQKGKPKKPLSSEAKAKLSRINKGKKLSEDTKRKITLSLRGMFAGDKHPNWKGSKTPENKRIRHCVEYKLWRKSVFERDNYTCVFCGATKVYIQADHIKPFALFPELRFAIDNGRTLCVPCHRSTDSYGVRS